MNKKNTLTPNQRRVYEFIKSHLSRTGKAPTLGEIAKEIRANSLRSVTQYLEILEKKHLIQRNRYAQRGIKLTEDKNPDEELISVPVFASAGCGSPSVIAERIFDEYITISSNLTGKTENLFVIKATGGSMVDAGISDGDFVLVEMTEKAGNNDLVVAIIEDTAVIKKITFANNAVILSPVSSDSTYQPIILQRDFRIFGRVIQIIKVQREDDLQYIPE